MPVKHDYDLLLRNVLVPLHKAVHAVRGEGRALSVRGAGRAAKVSADNIEQMVASHHWWCALCMHSR